MRMGVTGIASFAIFAVFLSIAALIVSSSVFAEPVSTNPDDVFLQIIEQKTEIDRGYVIYEIKNPTAAPITIDVNKIEANYSLGDNGKNVVKRHLEILSKINVTRTYYTPIYETLKYDNGSQYSIVKEISETQTTSEEDAWLASREVAPGQVAKVRETLYWPAGYRQSVDWQPSVNINGEEIKQTKWAWFNTSYSKGLNVYVNETYGKSWTNLALRFKGINLSGVSHNGDELVFVNQSCNGDGGTQQWMSFNGSLDGKNNKDFVNFTVFVNLTAYQNFTGCIYYANTTPTDIPTSRIFAIHDVFNESDVTDAIFKVRDYSGGSHSITSGELVENAAATTTWFTNNRNYVKALSLLNFSKGFSVACSWQVTSVSGSGVEAGCGPGINDTGDSSNGDAWNHTGIYYIRDENTDKGIRNLMIFYFADATTLSNVDGNQHVVYTKLNGTSNIFMNWTLNDSASVAGGPGSQFFHKIGSTANKISLETHVRTTGDTATAKFQWICAWENFNETCIAEDINMMKYIGSIENFSSGNVFENKLQINFTDQLGEKRSPEAVYYRLIHNNSNMADCSGIKVTNKTDNGNAIFNATKINNTVCDIWFLANITADYSGTVGYIYWSNVTPITPNVVPLSQLILFNETCDDGNFWDNSTGYNYTRGVSAYPLNCNNSIITSSEPLGDAWAYIDGGRFWNNYTLRIDVGENGSILDLDSGPIVGIFIVEGGGSIDYPHAQLNVDSYPPCLDADFHCPSTPAVRVYNHTNQIYQTLTPAIPWNHTNMTLYTWELSFGNDNTSNVYFSINESLIYIVISANNSYYRGSVLFHDYVSGYSDNWLVYPNIYYRNIFASVIATNIS